MLRKRKTRRYNEETNDEEGDCERKYDLKEQINSERFDSSQFKEKHLQELPGDAITLSLIQQNGFDKPILVTQPDGLNLRVPPKNFLVRDVRNYVGHDRIIDVMDVRTQKNIEMSMKDWCKYYESKSRDRLLNVISLEFSHTKLDELVDSPMIVKLLDWVDLVWPKFLKESQVESTNSIEKMKYPKVQKYCLMSVRGSYTDFHIDFGGTSVWYHMLKGKKIFWMVPPTDLNLQTFEDWTLSGMQQDVFFGDTVEECFRVELSAGNTFFIPSGWIHAVYTLEDSIVFGGNFLHSFGIENQLKVSKIEDATKVPIKFRYPFYTEILWYVVQHYVHCIANKDHLHRPVTEAPKTLPEKQTQNKAIALMNKNDSKSPRVQNDANDEDEEGETTESEHDVNETAIKNGKDSKKGAKRSAKTVAKRKRARPLTGKQQSQKKSKKTPSTDSSATEEDESTEIDSSNEDYVKPAKITTNTCRMTKNSLLRLQYEVDDQEPFQNRSTSSRVKPEAGKVESSSGDDKSSARKQSTSTSKSALSQLQFDQQRQPNTANTSNATLNLAEMVLSSHESKSNGWSASKTPGGSSSQTIWSSSVSREPERIHLTRYELNGLKALVKHLSKLSGAKKNLPTLIRNSRALLDDCRKMIAEHENDDSKLAVTGKPITLELLKSSKATDMNELIGQFFKTTNEVKVEGKELSSSFSISPNKSKNSMTEMISSSKSYDLERKAVTTSASSLPASSGNHITEHQRQDTTSIAPKSPHKETKCLSPTKKLFNVSASTSGHPASSSPPPRPKSPPTRPLSNNQYTSKTKNNNNLLLPGSFADLIAATSTEKKVFDYTGSDIASSLFAPSCSKSTTKHSTATAPNKNSKDVKNVGPSKISTFSADLSVSIAGHQPPNVTSSTPIRSANQPSQAQTMQTVLRQPNSPEPPKSSPPKRFINPQSFKPQCKEKLIFASAPYVNPVNVSNQLRASAPYPWQTPQPYNQATGTQLAPQSQVYSPSVIRAPVSVRSLQDDVQPCANQASTSVYNRESQLYTRKPSTNFQVSELARSVDSSQKSSNPTFEQHLVREQVTHFTPTSITDSTGLPSSQSASIAKDDDSSATSSNCSKIATSVSNQVDLSTHVKSEGASSATNKPGGSDLTDVKLPSKPRGPPKKSKEARQLIESSSCDQVLPLKPPVRETLSVSSAATSIPADKATVVQAPQSTQTRSNNCGQPIAIVSHKPPKAKRSKKKDESEPAVASANNIPPATIAPTSMLTNNPATSGASIRAPQPSVICSLVASQPSSTSASGPKLSQPSYLISRPLLFNTMPTFSHAQFQAMQQHQSAPRMPLYSIPISSPLNLPFQQNARIVWATQPRHPSSLNATPTPPNIPIGSAKPPTLPPPQDLNLFAPLVQRMPMTHFVTRSAAPRQPGGQLLFARLPPGANHVQGQPRYLITQPGFLQQHLPKS